MAKREYRKSIENKCDEYNKVDYDDVILLINEIETEVNTIRDKLNDFTNLTEIKDIYNIVDELSYKLY